MCFHFSQNKNSSELEKFFKAKKKPGVQITPVAHLNGFDLPQCAVITNEESELIQTFSWGLLPSYFKDLDIRRLTLNAKIETLNEKISFQKIISQRCLVPATSFFEWQWLNSKGTSNQKYEICVNQEELFAFGGLWHRLIWQNQLFETFTIITTEANDLMAKIHHTKKRMPLIIKPNDFSNYLQGQKISDFAFPYQSDLVAHQVIDEGKNFSLF